MLPISADTFPKTADELVTALRGGFDLKGLTLRAISAEGGYPQLTKLSIDITDAQVSRENRLGAVTGETGVGDVMFRLQSEYGDAVERFAAINDQEDPS